MEFDSLTRLLSTELQGTEDMLTVLPAPATPPRGRRLALADLKAWLAGFFASQDTQDTQDTQIINMQTQIAALQAGSGGAELPIGAVMLWLIETIPAKWYKLDGSPSPACLQGVFGATLPNMVFRIPLGAGGVYGLRSTGGADKKTLAISEIPPHTHSYTIAGSSVRYWAGGSSYDPDCATGTTGSTGGGAAFSLLNPYLAVYYIAYGGE